MKSTKGKSKKNNKLIISGFIALTIISVALCILAFIYINSDSDDRPDKILPDVTDITDQITTNADTTQKVEITEKIHESPKVSMTSCIGRELPDINIVLDKENNKTYTLPLEKLTDKGDTVNSFVFIIYSEDGVSDMGEFKGGFGISLTPGCEAADNKDWYQSSDIAVRTQGAYEEIVWTIPDEIKDYIDLTGQVMFGYWWSDVDKIRLSSVVCNKVTNSDVPVDGQSSKEINQSLSYSGSNEYELPASELTEKGDIVTAVTFNIVGEDKLGKFTFELSVKDKSENEYKLEHAVIYTDSQQASATWILPEDISVAADSDSIFYLRYWWSNCQQITVTTVDLAYRNNGTTVHKNVKPSETQSVKSESSAEKTFPSAADTVKNINVGWNLGNSLDSHKTETDDSETGWGNPRTTKEMIDTVKKAGFNTVRIPVTWYEHIQSGQISKDWLDRVQQVVDYAISDDLYVIINVHHDGMEWLNPTYDQQDGDSQLYTSIWKQISERFSSYDEHLLFEGLNEPRVVNTAQEWSGGTEEERDVINNYLKKFVETVRSTGGNNSQRILIVTTHAASVTPAAVNGLVIPDDDRIIVSVHNYSPWYFAGADETCNDRDWGTDQDKKELDSCFDMLKNKFTDRGVPVIIGEFGADNKNNDSDRAAWFEYYISSAKKRGIKCIVWDNGNPDEFGLLDRNNSTWYNSGLIQAIIKGAQ